jgi:hypothetical protein
LSDLVDIFDVGIFDDLAEALNERDAAIQELLESDNMGAPPEISDQSSVQDLTIEFITGTGPETRQFDNNSPLTNDLRSSRQFDIHVRKKARQLIHDFCFPNTQTCEDVPRRSRANRSLTRNHLPKLKSLPGLGLDVINMATNGRVPRRPLIVTFLGSWSAEITLTNIDCKNRTANVRYVVKNRTSLRSGMFGLLPNRERGVGSTILQFFEFDEDLHIPVPARYGPYGRDPMLGIIDDSLNSRPLVIDQPIMRTPRP